MNTQKYSGLVERLDRITKPCRSSTAPTAPPASIKPESGPISEDSKEDKDAAVSLESGRDDSQAPNTQPAKMEAPAGQVSGPSVAVEVIPARTSIELPDKLEDFSIEIKSRVQGQCRQFLAETIAIGEAFTAATKKYECDLKELAAKTDLEYNTVTQYVKVARCFGPSQASWAHAQLPGSVDSLVRLSRLKPEQLEDAVKKGKVKPSMGRKEVKAVLREYRPPSKKSGRRSGDDKQAGTSGRAYIDGIERQLIALSETVMKWKRISPESREELIDTLEHFDAWFRDFFRIPQNTDKFLLAEKSPTARS